VHDTAATARKPVETRAFHVLVSMIPFLVE
jgi:hypothetical protein